VSGFHDVSLPLAWALGARGGPTRRTDIVALGSGAERRATPWAHGRRRYDIGGAGMSADALSSLIAFFEARRGRLYAFRFRDVLDAKSCAPSMAVSPSDQILGTGDGATRAFSLRKAYGVGDAVYWRAVSKPVSGSVRVAVGGVEVAATGFALNVLSGVVTLNAAPASGAVVSAGFLFDTPVRFDADSLEVSLDAGGGGRALSVPLIEVLG
jgi:uncharacterized protein (TIGR02217 family)